jgi:hypothetical protein
MIKTLPVVTLMTMLEQSNTHIEAINEFLIHCGGLPLAPQDKARPGEFMVPVTRGQRSEVG